MKLKVRLNSIIIFLSLLCSFVPMSFFYISISRILIFIVRLVRIAVTAYFFIVCLKKKRHISQRFLWLLLFLLFLFLTTFINGGKIKTLVDNASIILLVSLLIECFIYQDGTCNYRAIKAMFVYFALMILLNLIGMIIKPGGVYRVVYEKTIWHEYSYPVFLLNTKNRLIEFELPLLVLTLLLYQREEIGKFITWISLTLIAATAILAKSLTSIAGLLLFTIVFLIIKRKKIRDSIRFLYPVFFVCQILSELVIGNSNILNLISFVFGRTDTVISRLELAEQAKEVIMENWLIGVGSGVSGRLFSQGSMIYWAHNHSLDLLVQSGTVGYLVFIRNLLGKVKTNNQLISVEQKIIFAAMAALFFMGMQESFVFSIEFYFILLLADI